jgi:hypothetical protein
VFLVVAMPSEKNKVSEAPKSKGKAMSFANSTLEFQCNIENCSFNRVKSTASEPNNYNSKWKQQQEQQQQH